MVVGDLAEVDLCSAGRFLEAEGQRRPGRPDDRRRDHHDDQDADECAHTSAHYRDRTGEQRVREQHDGTHERNDHQDVLARQHRMDVGVGRSRHRPALRRGERVVRQPVVRCLQHEVPGREQRQQLREPARDLSVPAPQPPGAVPVAADHGDPQSVGHRLRQQRHDHPMERIHVDEERDVLVEQRIRRMPRRGVLPHQERLPPTGGSPSHQDRRDDDGQQDEQAPHLRLVPAEQPPERVVVGRDVQRDADALQSHERQAADRTGDQPEHAEQQDLRTQHRRVHRPVVHRVEPEVGGEDAYRHPEQQPDRDERGDRKHRAHGPALERAAATGASYLRSHRGQLRNGRCGFRCGLDTAWREHARQLRTPALRVPGRALERRSRSCRSS